MSRKDFEKLWLNEEFMKSVFNTSVSPDECEVNWAVNVGDNHGSDILRVKYKGKSVIVKAELEGHLGAVVNEALAFEKELEFYSKFMPLAKEIIGHDVAPTYYSVGRLVVLEDLKPRGFGVNDRLAMLGYKRSMMAVRCLGEYHAAGHVLLKRHPDKFPWSVKDTFHTTSIANIMSTINKAVAEASKDWPEVSHLSNKLVALAESATQRVMDELTRPTELFTLTHGDTHSNNFLFHKDNNERPLLLDFQTTSRSSLAIDLIYISLLSIKEEVLQNHWSDLLHEYVTGFNEVISKTEVKLRLSVEKLKKEIDLFPCYELFAICSRGAIFLSPEGSDLGQKLANNALHELFDSDVFHQRVTKIIKKHIK